MKEHITLSDTVRSQEDWYADRPSMDEANDVETLKRLLCAEVEELCEQGADLREELADVYLFTVGLFRQLAIQAGQDTEEYMVQAIMEKTAVNILRYPAKSFQNGQPYEETMNQRREITLRDNIKSSFYQDYE